MFLFLLGGSFYFLNSSLRFKYDDGIYGMENFYRQERNSINLIAVGSSHIYDGIVPAMFWEKYHITSYCLGGSIQPVWNSYYYIKEALKTQKPDVIILDTYSFLYYKNSDFIYSDESRIVKNTFGMKLSRDKYDAVKVSTPQDEFWNYLLEFPVYHSRISELTKSDYLPYLGEESYYRYWMGNKVNEGTIAIDRNDTSNITRRIPLSEKNAFYLEKIIALTKEKGVPLLVITVPYEILEEDQAVFNSVADALEKNDVPYVNFNAAEYTKSYQYDHDFADAGHLNVFGNDIFTDQLGSYLMKNYSFHHQVSADTAYSYNQAAAYLEEIRADVQIRNAPELQSMIPLLRNENIITIAEVSHMASGYLASLGIMNDTSADENKAYVLSDGNLLSPEGEFVYEDKESRIYVKNGKINIDGTEYNQKISSGARIIVYDLIRNRIVIDKIYNETGQETK